jgi:hypothetical protein
VILSTADYGSSAPGKDADMNVKIFDHILTDREMLAF